MTFTELDQSGWWVSCLTLGMSDRLAPGPGLAGDASRGPPWRSGGCGPQQWPAAHGCQPVSPENTFPPRRDLPAPGAHFTAWQFLSLLAGATFHGDEALTEMPPTERCPQWREMAA